MRACTCAGCMAARRRNCPARAILYLQVCTMDDGNGILSKIPSQYVAAANQILPKAETAVQDSMEAVREVPGFGNVRFTFKRLRHKRGKSVHYFWCATRAELVDKPKS